MREAVLEKNVARTIGNYTRVPKIPPAVHCKGCWLWEDRKRVARALDDVLTEYTATESEGQWDYQTCYAGCLRRRLHGETRA